jgi:hypothetical protein
MPTKYHTLIPYHLWDHNIFLAPAKGGQQSFRVLEILFLEYLWIVGLQILVSRWVRYMPTKSHMHTRCGTLRKSSISTRGYAEIHIQGPILDNKISIWNILGLKIQTVGTCFSACSIHRIFFIKKTLKSRFLMEFQSFIFWQILANLGSFGQFWADFVALTVANSMPQLGLKS